MTEFQSSVTFTGAPALLDRVEYLSGVEWRALPTWAHLLAGVGAYAASRLSDSDRLVIVLTLPARAFAAGLVAAGGVITAFLANPPGTDALQHFEYLAGLPPGTPVTRRFGNSIARGRLLGMAKIDGVELVSVEFKDMISRLPQSLCTQIHPTDGRTGTAMSKRKLVRAPGFLAQVCPSLNAASFCATARLDCVLIGNQGALREELTAEQFRAADGGVAHRGTLQDLARARYIAGANDTFRSAVVSATAETSEKPSANYAPALVVFDGSRAFGNWRSQWEDANWVVLLDRSSPSAAEGAAAVVDAFAMRAADAALPSTLEVPPSVEALAWTEVR